jgi:copper oxidase (laccase) domain-containing protein
MPGLTDEKNCVAAAGPSDAFVLPEWPARETIGALTTTRRGGHSRGPYGGFNLALHVGDYPKAVLANRGALVSRLRACEKIVRKGSPSGG